MSKKISEEKKQEILRLADGTRTLKEVAAIVGVSKCTAIRYAKGRGISPQEQRRRALASARRANGIKRKARHNERVEAIRKMGREATYDVICRTLGISKSCAIHLKREALGGCTKEERYERSRRAIRKQIADERVRIKWGLPQKTNRKLTSGGYEVNGARYRLRKRGYVFFPDEPRTAYYDQQTSRSAKMEANAAKHHFTFKELDE